MNYFYKKCIICLLIFLASGCDSIFGKNFASVEECFEYIKSKAITNEKLFVGGISCRFIFPTNQETDTEKRRSFGKCLINKYDQIVDDSSGTRVVNGCAEKADDINLGRFLAKKFSASERMAVKIEEQREELKNLHEEQQDRLQNMLEDQNILRENVLRSPIECIRVGVIIQCD